MSKGRRAVRTAVVGQRGPDGSSDRARGRGPGHARRPVGLALAMSMVVTVVIGIAGVMWAPAAGAATGAPFGYLDSVVLAPGGVQVTGWSIDPDTRNPIIVDLYVDGAYVRSSRADRARPDVAAAVPGGYGERHGYAELLPVPEGAHSFCAYGLNVAGGAPYTLLGCLSTTVTRAPFGALDVVQRVPGTRNIQVAGWSLDPDTAASLQIDLYVNNNYAGSTMADRARGDVAVGYPWAGAAHGYDLSFELWEGVHTVCAYAINIGPGAPYTGLGCKQVNFTSTPLGAIDGARSGDGVVRVSGWALDPDTVAALDVHFYVDGAFVTIRQASQARGDIATLYPAFGPGHGFTVDLPAAPNASQVCAYAINQGAGPDYVGLGCAAIAPQPPVGSGSGRRIVYANLSQRLWLVGDDGLVEASYPISGKYLDPPPGVYAVYAFQRYADAGHDGITMEYFVAFNPAGLGYGFHTIPVFADGSPLQGEDELGFFRSAGCVRQRRGDAIFLWNWAHYGDPVVVLAV